MHSGTDGRYRVEGGVSSTLVDTDRLELNAPTWLFEGRFWGVQCQVRDMSQKPKGGSPQLPTADPVLCEHFGVPGAELC